MSALYNNFTAKKFSGVFLFLFLLISLPLLVVSTLTARDSRSKAAEDMTPPTTPQGVRAMITLDGVKVFWNPSSDDVGVFSYKVFRNGVQIAETPAELTEWPDVTAVSPYNYTYSVVARDASGKESQPGVQTMIRSCDLLDTTGDNAIDLSDTLDILQHFGDEGSSFANWDMDGNNWIDLGDALINLQYFGEDCDLFASKPGPAVAASSTSTAPKVNKQITLRPGQEIKVGTELSVTWDWVFKPTSDPGALVIIGRAVVGSESKYIGFVVGGSKQRAQDQAFGYTFRLKSATEKSATILIKN